MPRNTNNPLFWLIYGLLLLGWLALGTSCGQLKQQEFNTGYYPLRQTMLQEVQRHTRENTKMEKAVYMDGKWETRTEQPLDSTIWHTELAAFMEANINLPANQGLYKVDTLFVETDSLNRITYLATKSGLRTRYLYIYQKPGTKIPALIEARLEQQNVLFSSVQELVYIPDSGYSITGYQDVFILGLDSFAVQTTFID